MATESTEWSWLVAAATWLLVLGFFAIGNNVEKPNWSETYALLRHGSHVEATVTAVLPQSHATCRYSYSVNGKTYHGSDEGCAGERAVGDALPLLYLPSDPSVAIVGSVGGQVRDELIIDIGVPTFFAWGFGTGQYRRLFGNRGSRFESLGI